MQVNLDQELNMIERNSKGWRSLTHYDRILLQQLGTCLQACLAVTSDNLFLDLVIHQRPQAFDMFEYAAVHLFKQWHHQNRSLVVEQLNYLTIVGTFNRRMALTLQNDNDDTEGNTDQTEKNLEHQIRVRELLFDNNNNEIFDILTHILPEISKNELNFIEMILPWYECYIFFEHNYIDSTLDENFLSFYHQIIQCLKSNQYEQSLFFTNDHQLLTTTVRDRFYLGICTMAMGIHVNCDETECHQAKNILEVYLSRYIIFLHSFVIQNEENSLNNLVCLTGILTYLVNYTLIIDHNYNQQLLMDLFSLILQEKFYCNIKINWSTYETILIDSIICYLILYCFDNRILIQQILRTNENYIQKFEYLIKQAQISGNRRIAIMSQLFLLILTSSTKLDDLTEKLFYSCINYIHIASENIHSYHYNQIPMSIFLKSLIQIVKYEYIQEIIRNQYFNLFINIIINYEKNYLYDRECTIITLSILWTLSFNDNIKRILKQTEQSFFEVIQKINTNINEMSVKQATCGLLYNLDRLDVSKNTLINAHNFGKTIGISHDLSDHKTVQMIEQELNKTGHRVWTTYDHMDGHFIPSFISIMNSTQYLIVCLSDMYTLNNRCRTEFLYATTFNHRVLSWKVHIPTNNPDEDEQIRIHAVQTLLNRITSTNDEKTQTSNADTTYVQIHMEKCSTFTNFHRRQRTKEMLKLENWTNVEVLTWCQAINLPGFFKLLANFDGRSVVKLYEFCKRNSIETISLLNHDLHNLCEHDNIPDIQISVHEFIRFQIEVEKLFSTTLMKKSSSKLDIYKKRSKIKICSIL